MTKVLGTIVEQRSKVIKRYRIGQRTEAYLAGFGLVVLGIEDIPNLNSFMSNRWKDFIIKKMRLMKVKKAFSLVFKDLYIFRLSHLFGPCANSGPFQFLDLSVEETFTVVLW